MRIYTAFSIAILMIGTANGAPVISSLSGNIANNQAITISGQGFGSHSLEVEWLGDSIESGSVGQNFNRPNWTMGWGFADTKFANDKQHSGNKSLKVYVDGANAWNGILSYKTKRDIVPGDKIYISWWMQKDSTSNNGQWKMLRVSGNETVVDGPQEAVLFNWNPTAGGGGSKQFVIDPRQGNDQSFWMSDV